MSRYLKITCPNCYKEISNSFINSYDEGTNGYVSQEKISKEMNVDFFICKCGRVHLEKRKNK